MGNIGQSAKRNFGIPTLRKKSGRYYCKNASLICFCQKPFVKLAMCLLPIRLDVAQQCLPFAAVIGGGGGGGGRGRLGRGGWKRKHFVQKLKYPKPIQV